MKNQFQTKNDYIEFLRDMILPLAPYYSKGKAELKFGTLSSLTSEKTQCTEAFMRPLWGLAPLWGCGGECGSFNEIYRQGITNGTNPHHPEYFGELKSHSQELCDSVVIALSLALAPDILWKPLSESEKGNIVKWLLSGNDCTHVDNNWNFFQLLINVCLKKLDAPYSQSLIDEKLMKIESFYRGDGWYSDGGGETFDYYNAFAFHFYSLIYAVLMKDDDFETCQRFKERAMLFAKHYIYFFGNDGQEIPYGRSLTYRFGHIAFWSACLFAGIDPFPVEVIKGIIARNLRFWHSKPIFDNAGIITAGYGYNQPQLVEEYSCYGSPYWCLKTFLILLLPENHPFWQAEEAPLPPLESTHIIKPASMVIQRIGDNAYLYPAIRMGCGANYYIEKYNKFIYSSKHAFSLSGSFRDLSSSGPDSMLLFEKDGVFFPRCTYTNFQINDDGSVYSEWSPFEGVIVKTILTPTEKGHIRTHEITSDKEYSAYDCGFASLDDDYEICGIGEVITTDIRPNTNLYFSKVLSCKAIKYAISPGKMTVKTEFCFKK